MSNETQPYLSPEYQAQVLAEFLDKHVKPYDPNTDDYDRPPFAEDIKIGKNDPIYNAHSYHTKVPPRSIIPYILHYTRPGDVVLDPFCGSGMTGVAAQMCANPPADLLAQFPDLKDRVGPRACILNDLSPAACHIAFNYNTPVDTEALRREFERIKAAVKDEFDWLYGTEHYEPAVGLYSPNKPEVLARLKNPPDGASVPRLFDDNVDRTWELLSRAEVESRLGYPVTELPSDSAWGELNVSEADQWICIPATIQYTIWSDVYRCEGFVTVEEPTGKLSTRGKNVGKPMIRKKRVARGCGSKFDLWSTALDRETGEVAELFSCPNCGHMWKKTQLKKQPQLAVLCQYEYELIDDSRSSKSARRERRVSERESLLVSECENQHNPYPSPNVRWDKKWPQYRRNALGGRGIETVADFYTARNRRALGCIFQASLTCSDARLAAAMIFNFTSIFRFVDRRAVYSPNGLAAVTGTLYFPSLSVEHNIWKLFESKMSRTVRAFASQNYSAAVTVTCGSATDIAKMPSMSVDYIFTDPPFGSNIYYSEMNLLWEGWLGRLTQQEFEAVVHRKNDGGAKTIADYRRLMTSAFREMFRVLKPGRWATVEFNNSDGMVFEAIKEGVRDAGFQIVNMLLLDKAKKTFKQIKGAAGEEDVVDKDVLFNLHKPSSVQTPIRAEQHDLEHQVVDVVRQHLLSLPARIAAEPSKYSDEHRTTATINSMLMNTLIPSGVSVEQLNLPFIDRVCSRYFRKVGQHWYLRGEAVGSNGNGGLFPEEVVIRDSLSAIDWLRQKLRSGPMLVGELKPLWMRATGLLPAELSQDLILEELLTENFWRDQDTNRWREPTDEERERMNDDRSLRILHDAERYVASTLRRSTTDAERCDWIDVLFRACRQVEDGDFQSTPTLREFDPAEGYRLITRLFQSVLRDHVASSDFDKASKQATVASKRVAGAVRRDEEALAALRKRKERTLFDWKDDVE